MFLTIDLMLMIPFWTVVTYVFFKAVYDRESRVWNLGVFSIPNPF